MKILMIANYVEFGIDGGNSRFTYILDKIDCLKNNVELITTDFNHGKKMHRDLERYSKIDSKYKITLIHEPGYIKNVSLKRFYSHYKLGKNLKKYLNKLEYRPDVIYCAVPSLDVAKVATKFAKKNNIRFIVDIQDLWPEAFKMVFNIPILSNLIFYPMKKQADYIYSNADEIIAVSETYCNRALKVNKKVNKGFSIFLGTDLKNFDKFKQKNEVNYDDNIIRIAYIGTLGHSYDIKAVIDAISILNEKGINNIKFLIMGDGPLKNNFEKYAESKKIDYEFTGKLKYEEMVGKLCSCDIAVNPIVKGAAQSIINKVGDYASAGLPVISTQECEEYINLLNKYNAGINCKNGNNEELSNAIEELVNNEKLRKELGMGNIKLAEEKFDRNKTYQDIINMLNSER